MAKMFYSVEEAAERLSMTPDQVTELVTTGKLQEFRDRDRLVFKKDQVDMLADPGTGSLGGSGGMIPLADSALGGSGLGLSGSGGSGLGLSGSGGGLGGSDIGLSLEDTGSSQPAPSPGFALADENKDRSGIAIFDADATDEGDPSAVTRITQTAGPAGELNLESVGSGSGLLDLTREGDDTSLGADLLQDVYSEGDSGLAAGSETQGSSGLFESTPAASDVSAAAAPAIVMAAAEPYDSTWSGIAGGVALGAALVCAFALAAVIFGFMGGQSNPVVELVRSGLPMWLGILAGVIVVPAVVGLLLGKRAA